MKDKKVTLDSLKKFIAAVEKKYGKKALKFRVEVHHPFQMDGETAWEPNELDSLSVATYAADDDYEEETVVVVR